MGKDFSNLGDWLPKQLRRVGLSVEQLARLAGLSRASVYFYIDDTCRPTEQSMVKICSVLGVPLDVGLRQYTPRQIGRHSS